MRLAHQRDGAEGCVLDGAWDVFQQQDYSGDGHRSKARLLVTLLCGCDDLRILGMEDRDSRYY